MSRRPLLAEFLGTLALIYVGVGAIAVSAAGKNGPDLVAVALAHGLTIAVMASATGAISGGHLNPAVTLGVLVGGRIRPLQAAGYWAAQLLGGLAGALLVRLSLPAEQLSRAGYGVPKPGQGIGGAEALVMEVVLTFFLVFVVFGTALDSRAPRVGGLFIGLTVTLDILVGGPISGAAMNPARFLGPGLVFATALQHSWIYVLGPLVGAVLAALTWRLGLAEPAPADVSVRA